MTQLNFFPDDVVRMQLTIPPQEVADLVRKLKEPPRPIKGSYFFQPLVGLLQVFFRQIQSVYERPLPLPTKGHIAGLYRAPPTLLESSLEELADQLEQVEEEVEWAQFSPSTSQWCVDVANTSHRLIVAFTCFYQETPA